MQKNLFQICLPQEAGAFRENIEKEPQKPRLKLKNIYIIFTENICSACSPMQVVVFFLFILIL